MQRIDARDRERDAAHGRALDGPNSWMLFARAAFRDAYDPGACRGLSGGSLVGLRAGRDVKLRPDAHMSAAH